MKKECRDRDNFILKDVWIGEVPPNAGELWQSYFDTHKKKRII